MCVRQCVLIYRDAEMIVRSCVKIVAVFPRSGRAALPLSGGPGSVRRGGGPVDRGAAEAGGRGEEDPHQAVLLWGQVQYRTLDLAVHLIVEFEWRVFFFPLCSFNSRSFSNHLNKIHSCMSIYIHYITVHTL